MRMIKKYWQRSVVDFSSEKATVASCGRDRVTVWGVIEMTLELKLADVRHFGLDAKVVADFLEAGKGGRKLGKTVPAKSVPEGVASDELYPLEDVEHLVDGAPLPAQGLLHFGHGHFPDVPGLHDVREVRQEIAGQSGEGGGFASFRRHFVKFSVNKLK